MDQQEVARIAGNVWGYTERGQNRFGQHGAWFPTQEANDLVKSQDELILLIFLRANNHPDATFWVANGLAKVLGWTRQRVASARRGLIERGYIRQVRAASGENGAALYRWHRSGHCVEN